MCAPVSACVCVCVRVTKLVNVCCVCVGSNWWPPVCTYVSFNFVVCDMCVCVTSCCVRVGLNWWSLV